MRKGIQGVGMLAAGFVSLAGWVAVPAQTRAHCDTLDGPVMKEARAAIEKGDVTPTLKWVKKEDEGEVRAAFSKAVAVRALGPEAKDLADRYFLETLVRIHRAGEGAPYTGLKPAGTQDPAVIAADKALEKGTVGEVIAMVEQEASSGIRSRFVRALERRKRAGASIVAGRAYVAAYVDYIHYVERLYNAAARGMLYHVEGTAVKGGEGHHPH